MKNKNSTKAKKLIAGLAITLTLPFVASCDNQNVGYNNSDTSHSDFAQKQQLSQEDTQVIQETTAKLATDFLEFSFGGADISSNAEFSADFNVNDNEATASSSSTTETSQIDLSPFFDVNDMTQEQISSIQEFVFSFNFAAMFFYGGSIFFTIDKDKVEVNPDGETASLKGSGITLNYDKEKLAKTVKKTVEEIEQEHEIKPMTLTDNYEMKFIKKDDKWFIDPDSVLALDKEFDTSK